MSPDYAPILLDIETIAHERAREFFPPPDVEFLTPPKNYSKVETILRWKDEEKARRLAQWETELERCALDPDLNRVIAIGWMSVDQHEPIAMTCPTEAHERQALTAFWEQARHRQLIGYNIAGFDVPTLLRRSLLLDIDAPGLSISKYRHPAITDLMKLLSFDGLLPWRKQSFYLRRFGLDQDLPCDDVNGEDIAQLVAEGNWPAVLHHVQCDVLGVRALARYLGLVGSRPPRESAETAVM